MLFLSLYHHFSTCKQNHESKATASNSSAVSDFLIRKHQISPQVASRVASALPHVEKNPNKLDSVISFLNHYGFSKPQLERVMKSCPQLLMFSLDNLKPKFEHFHNFGFSNTQTVGVISKDPLILKRSLSETIAPALTVLNGLLGSKDEVLKLLMRSQHLLSHDLENTLVPNIDYFLSCGVAMDMIRRYLHCRFLLQKPEVMKQVVDRADRLGADRSSRRFLEAVKSVDSMNEENWERKLQWFRELGCSEDDMSGIIRKAPQLFSLSLENLESKLKVFRELGCSEDDISGIIRKAPSVFGYSLESLESKLKAFRAFGFSEADISGIIRKTPQLFNMSFKNLNSTKEVLLATGKYTVESVIRHPIALMYSVEKRYKLRVSVLGVLERKNLIKEWPSLGVLCRQTDRKFFEKFVAPHLNEISEVLPNVVTAL